MMTSMLYQIWLLLSYWLISIFGNDIINLREEKWDVICNNKNISITVNIPKSVHIALLENNFIKDPYFGTRDKQYAWIADENWLYQTIFYVSKEMLDYTMVRLTFDGLDTVSKILLNGFVIGKTDNMFVKYTFMVKKYIKLRNVLQVYFSSPTKYSSRKSKKYFENFGYNVPPVKSPPVQHGRNHPNFIRKEQCSFSWDWGPSFPTVGIWKDAFVEFSNFAYLDDVLIHIDSDKEDTMWHVHFEAVIQVNNGSEIIVSYGFSHYQLETEILVDNQNSGKRYLGFIEVPKYAVELWWPHGYGRQTLYRASVHVTDPVSRKTISKYIKFGFRTVELVQTPINNSHGLSFYFKINSMPIFLKGANWIPADLFQERVTSTIIKDLFNSSLDANINALRVWGGGIYEQDQFYELADELGIVIWQDLMFAVALYPVNSEFLKSVQREMLTQVRRLQYHPSIIAWSGNNENEAAIAQSWWKEVVINRDRLVADYKKLYVETIQPIFVAEDRTRPFVLSSPSNGAHESHEIIDTDPQSPFYGDVHYYNYIDDCWDTSIFPKPRFASEYGYQSYPSQITLSKIASSDELTWGSFLMNYRQHHANGNKEIVNFIKQHYSLPHTNHSQDYFHYMVYLSQIVQATCVKYETEHYRRLQGNLINHMGFTMGALYWQLNDIWQGPSWSSLEYGGRWKMLHYYVKEFFQPTAVNGHIKNDQLYIHIVNDHPKKDVELRLNITAHNFLSFKILWNYSIVISSQQEYAFEVYRKNISDICPDKMCFCKLKLMDASSHFIFSQSDVFFSSLSSMSIIDPKLKISQIIIVNKYNYKIMLQSESSAAFVWLETTLHGKFSKNGFMMIEPKVEILFQSQFRTSAEKLESTLKVISLYDTYKV